MKTQIEIAKEIGISSSYLSMILNGKRKCPPELLSKLQATQGIHKIVKKSLRKIASKQAVAGSSPVSRSTFPLDLASESLFRLNSSRVLC